MTAPTSAQAPAAAACLGECGATEDLNRYGWCRPCADALDRIILGIPERD